MLWEYFNLDGDIVFDETEIKIAFIKINKGDYVLRCVLDTDNYWYGQVGVRGDMLAYRHCSSPFNALKYAQSFCINTLFDLEMERHKSIMEYLLR